MIRVMGTDMVPATRYSKLLGFHKNSYGKGKEALYCTYCAGIRVVGREPQSCLDLLLASQSQRSLQAAHETLAQL